VFYYICIWFWFWLCVPDVVFNFKRQNVAGNWKTQAKHQALPSYLLLTAPFSYPCNAFPPRQKHGLVVGVSFRFRGKHCPGLRALGNFTAAVWYMVLCTVRCACTGTCTTVTFFNGNWKPQAPPPNSPPPKASQYDTSTPGPKFPTCTVLQILPSPPPPTGTVQYCTAPGLRLQCPFSSMFNNQGQGGGGGGGGGGPHQTKKKRAGPENN
jgi:hypothetical protein